VCLYYDEYNRNEKEDANDLVKESWGSDLRKMSRWYFSFDRMHVFDNFKRKATSEEVSCQIYQQSLVVTSECHAFQPF